VHSAALAVNPVTHALFDSICPPFSFLLAGEAACYAIASHPAACFPQVHRAVGRDGRQLAVKVQHAGLRESGAADTATIGLAVALLRWFAPDYDYRWVVDETRTSLPLVRIKRKP
jgi:ABC1 atypical kinase-like domain